MQTNRPPRLAGLTAALLRAAFQCVAVPKRSRMTSAGSSLSEGCSHHLAPARRSTTASAPREVASSTLPVTARTKLAPKACLSSCRRKQPTPPHELTTTTRSPGRMCSLNEYAVTPLEGIVAASTMDTESGTLAVSLVCANRYSARAPNGLGSGKTQATRSPTRNRVSSGWTATTIPLESPPGTYGNLSGACMSVVRPLSTRTSPGAIDTAHVLISRVPGSVTSGLG
mmetsp:Transcript_9022/g.21046  ORF Transcript_9022/g.21046 Transcript_9022/m.21046 type:complete len:227 (-) Transcript_9022:278-958(-)